MNTRSSSLRRFAPRLISTSMVDAVALVTMLAIAMWTFRSSYGGVLFLVIGLICAVAGIALAWVSTRLRWPVWVTAACGLIVYVVLGTWFARRYDAIAGVIPSPRSMLGTLSSSITAWKELVTITPPVGSTGDLMIIPVFVGFVGGLLGYSAARRWRFVGPVLLVPLVVTGLGIAVGTDKPVSLIVNGVVLTLVMVGWTAWRENKRRPEVLGGKHTYRRLATATMMMGVAAAVGFVAAPRLPGNDATRAIWRQTVTPPFDPRVYPSPLAGYRHYVKPGYDANKVPNPAKKMFLIQGLPTGVPVRLATMDSYDGLVWQVSGGDPADPSLHDSGSFERIGSRLNPDVDGNHATVTVTIEEYADVWVPNVGEVISIRFVGSAGGPARDRLLNETFRYNRATDTGATPIKLVKGDRYVMEVRLPNMLDTFAGHPIEPTVPRIGTARPALAVTQALATPDLLALDDNGARIDKIRDRMFLTGWYSDGDQQANQVMVTAGHSEARLTSFVDGLPRAMIGNAEQFSAAFALLFRDLGNVPTRVVMGFMPSKSSLTTPVEVTQTEVEAWVEVPVTGMGWVAVYPTPPRDQVAVSTAATEQPEPDYRTQNPAPPPLVDPEFDQAATARGKAKNQTPLPKDAPVVDKPLNDDAGLMQSQVARRAAIAASPFVLLALFAFAVVLIKFIRRRRRRRRGAAHQRIANGWREVTDLATDLGRPVPPTNTRREAAAFVGSSSLALAVRTDSAVWGGYELSDSDVDAYWEELEQTLHSIRTEAPWRQRLRSRISIQSLKRQNKRGERGRTN